MFFAGFFRCQLLLTSPWKAHYAVSNSPMEETRGGRENISSTLSRRKVVLTKVVRREDIPENQFASACH